MKDIAEHLTKFGEVAIFSHGNGWVCKCEMYVTGKGVKVEVKSDRDLPSLEEAVHQCLERCISCISELNTRTEKIPELKEVLE